MLFIKLKTPLEYTHPPTEHISYRGEIHRRRGGESYTSTLRHKVRYRVVS